MHDPLGSIETPWLGHQLCRDPMRTCPTPMSAEIGKNRRYTWASVHVGIDLSNAVSSKFQFVCEYSSGRDKYLYM